MMNDGVSPEQALVERAIAGDRAALDELLRLHLPDLRVFVRLQVGPALRARESCSDLVQSVCRELIEGLERFEYRGDGGFRHWLYVATLNKIRQHDRHQRAARRDPARESPDFDAALSLAYGSHFSPSRQAMGQEMLARLDAAFDQLPTHYREVLTLARIAGLPLRTVAVRMQRTEDSVRNLLLRATARLAAVIDEGGGL